MLIYIILAFVKMLKGYLCSQIVMAAEALF